MSAALAAATALLWRRRRHDAASAQEQRRVSTILDHASDPILFLSPDGRVAHANQRANEFYGAEGLIGRSLIDDLVGPEDRTTLREGLSVAAATGEVVVETNHRRGDGTAAPVEMSVRRLTLDDDTHLVAVVRDLSARREVESALRRSESLFRTVFQRSPIGILMGTLDGRILARESGGRTDAWLLGRRADDHDVQRSDGAGRSPARAARSSPDRQRPHTAPASRNVTFTRTA